MKCRIDGCEKEVAYKQRQLCQMHYFRHMRNGSYDLKEVSIKYKGITPNGYVTVHEPDHYLAKLSGRNRLFEHRVVYFNEIDSNPTNCALCGKEIDWKTLHIDHINCDRTDNRKENLRALCRPCNTGRGHTEYSKNKYLLTINGLTLGPMSWAKRDDVEVTSATIRRRKREGYSDYDCVYGEKKTHNGKVSKRKRSGIAELD